MAHIFMREREGANCDACIDDCPFHADECTDCGLCSEPCFIESVLTEEELPESWKRFIEKTTE